jgi:uncharacterized protein DUF5134
MAAPEPLLWLLTVALAGATAFHVGRALRPRLRPEHRVAEALHAVMGLAMVAMLWPFGRVVPASAWLAVFAGSTGWFAAQASSAVNGRIVPAYFASAGAAMVWMSSAMRAAPVMATVGSAMTAGPATAAFGDAMPTATDMAVDMPGMGHHAVWAAAVIGGYLVAAGLCWLLGGLPLGALRTTPRETARCDTHWPALCHGVMGVSMGLAVLTMF